MREKSVKMSPQMAHDIIPLSELRLSDVARVGGKNASLGELIGGLSAAGVRVPDGFATDAGAYRRFLRENKLDAEIRKQIAALDINDTRALAHTAGEIRRRIMDAPLPAEMERELRTAYEKLGGAVAVRSSATAEDLPDASFAGQQETFLNIRGADAVVDATRRVFASFVYRSRGRLSPPSRLRKLRCRAVGCGAKNGAERLGGERRDVYAGHRIGL